MPRPMLPIGTVVTIVRLGIYRVEGASIGTITEDLGIHAVPSTYPDGRPGPFIPLRRYFVNVRDFPERMPISLYEDEIEPVD